MQEIAEAADRAVQFVPISHEAFAEGLAQSGLPAEFADLLKYLFLTVLDGRNARLSDGVQRALGRSPKDFRDYARNAAASGAWKGSAEGVACA